MIPQPPDSLFETIVSIAADAIVAVDENRRIVLFNWGAEQVFQYQAPEILGQPLDLLIPERFVESHRERVREFAAGPQTARRMNERGEIAGRRKDGTEFPAEASIAKTAREGKSVLAVFLRDVTARKQAEARLTYLAYYDALTGLPNRMLFADRLKQAMLEGIRREHPVAVLLMDVDRFRTFNDTLGHEAGDQLLRAASQRLRLSTRESDTLARLGGDEFGIVLTGLRDESDIGRAVQRILDSFAEPLSVEEQTLYVTMSIGVSVHPGDSLSAEGLIRNADAALSRARELGGNAFQFFRPEMYTRTAKNLALENDLRRSLPRGDFILHYQPQFDLKTGDLIGAEALVRWMHPQRGLVPPGDFIPLAEETGLIVPLGEVVLRQALSQAKAWHDGGLPPLPIAVNFSVRQFRHAAMVETVHRALEETGADPRWLDIELTESSIMKNPEAVIASLGELKRLGILVSVDDFGTGYSSLAHLKRFPIDVIKVDQSFVRNVTTDPNDAAIAAAIVTMAQTLGMRVIAEGVETEGQAGFLRSKGCDGAQGYLFSRPLPAEAFREFVEEKNRQG
ncbi:MAG: EAL domain-containing protein [Nitrospirae bacterium]|nr:EAL domain-containing protein [Nitrospirota bacterium]